MNLRRWVRGKREEGRGGKGKQRGKVKRGRKEMPDKKFWPFLPPNSVGKTECACRGNGG